MGEQSSLSNFESGDSTQVDQYECGICGRSFDSAKGKGSHVGQKHDDSEIKSALINELRRLADELGRAPGRREMDKRGKYSERFYREKFGSWNEAIRKAGLEVNGKYNIAKSDLLNELRDFADELGQTPIKMQMKESGAYDPTTYMQKFGSWNEALRETGLEINKDKNISDSDLLGELTRLADELGQTPKAGDMNQQGKYNSGTYARKFDSWNEALAEAGLEISKAHRVTKSALIDELSRLEGELNRTPRQQEMNQQGAYSAQVYSAKFDSWNKALQEAGLEINKADGIAKSDLLGGLQDLANELGRTPRQREMNRIGQYSSSSYTYQFGSWNEALAEAGLETQKNMDVSESALLNELGFLADKIGRAPTIDEMNQRGKYSVGPYRDKFGSWNETLQEAGVEINKADSIAKSDLLDELQHLTNELGRTPRQREMNKQGAYTRKFGSWTEAVREAGLDPNGVYFPDQLDHRVRSSYEEKIANILLDEDVEYNYESLVIEYGDDRSYTPDFVTDQYVIEVKGYVYRNEAEKAGIAKQQLTDKQYVVIQESGPKLPADEYIQWEDRHQLRELF
jgi:hypothetical protein